MRKTSPLTHRLQLGAAVVAVVGGVWVVGVTVNHATRKAAPPPPTVRYVPPTPPPPVMPKVVESTPIPQVPDPRESLEYSLIQGANAGNLKDVQTALDKGANVHVDEVAMNAPVLLADKYPEVTKLLLERGAVEPTLDVAIQAGAPNAVARSLAKHPVISAEALTAAIDLDEGPTRTKLLDSLLAGKLAPDAIPAALDHVTGERDAALVKKLGPRISWTYHDGEDDASSPLVSAVERSDTALVKAMLEVGAPADFHHKDGRCALGTAIEIGAERIVELLLQRGANANRRLPDGRTPLFAAAESGNVRIVKALVGSGARVNERVLDETALDAAERNGNTAAMRVLDGHGGRRAPQPKEPSDVLMAR